MSRSALVWILGLILVSASIGWFVHRSVATEDERSDSAVIQFWIGHDRSGPLGPSSGRVPFTSKIEVYQTGAVVVTMDNSEAIGPLTFEVNPGIVASEVDELKQISTEDAEGPGRHVTGFFVSISLLEPRQHQWVVGIDDKSSSGKPVAATASRILRATPRALREGILTAAVSRNPTVTDGDKEALARWLDL